MIYLKSLLAGLIAVVVTTAAFVVFAITVVIHYSTTHSTVDGASVGWDPISLTRPPFWFIVFIVLTFWVGFFWEYRRLAK